MGRISRVRVFAERVTYVDNSPPPPSPVPTHAPFLGYPLYQNLLSGGGSRDIRFHIPCLAVGPQMEGSQGRILNWRNGNPHVPCEIQEMRCSNSVTIDFPSPVVLLKTNVACQYCTEDKLI